MKTSLNLFRGTAAALVLVSSIAAVSCNKLPGDSPQGSLSWNFSGVQIPTRSVAELPDTDNFILRVSSSTGAILYEGTYGRSPESLMVDPGSYTVKVVSRDFSVPEFSAPQFGDEQVVVVKAGSAARVLLNCTQQNSGLRIRFGGNFKEAYPSGRIDVSSAEGSLRYSLGELRTGYFKPGKVTMSLFDGQSSSSMFSRNLEACEVFTLGVSCSSQPSGSGTGPVISVSVDTSRTWSFEDYEIGSGASSGSTMATAYSVGQAKDHAGEKGVWVCGYIVGGDLSSSKNGIVFEPPFASMTNIAVAARSSVTEKASCMSVQLSQGSIRSALNLVEHPELLGSKIYLKGDIVGAYYGIPGIQNLTEYIIK